MRHPYPFAALASCALALSGFTCVELVEESNRTCPCSTGWTCCADSSVCVRDGASCPAAACTPDCGNDRCGSDGCGGWCKPCQCGEETCPPDEVCTPVGRCGTLREGTRPAKVMLLLDRSASMKDPGIGASRGCATATSGYDPTGECKWNDLKYAVGDARGFIDTLGNQARVGLTAFPRNGESAASGGPPCRGTRFPLPRKAEGNNLSVSA